MKRFSVAEKIAYQTKVDEILRNGDSRGLARAIVEFFELIFEEKNADS